MTDHENRAGAALIGAVSTLALLTGCTAAFSADGGDIVISGSSTVAPISEAIAADGGVEVDLEAEGTTAGFEHFCRGESHINNASEAIPGEGQPVDYVQLCADNGVEFLELPVATDALSLVRHIDNDFASDLTLDELQAIWEPGSTVSTWQDVRADWPDEQITLVGRPSGSGTFDYFTHFVNGEAGAVRDDYETTNDLDELSQWIADDPNALGFMGVGNYLAADESARNVMTTVAVDGVEPTLMNAQDGSYTPFTRPLFIYVSVAALEEEAGVEDYVEHYLDAVDDILPSVYFYRLPDEVGDLVADRFSSRTTGTVYEGDPYRETGLAELLRSHSS